MIPRHLLIALALLLVAVFGLGFYVLHLRSVAEANLERMQDTRPVAPPVAGPLTRVALFVADDRDGMLHEHAASLALPQDPGQRGREILRALVGQYLEKSSPHPLGEGADVKEVFLIRGDTAVIDTTRAFADGHRSGILVEELTLASLAQTLAANMPGVMRIKVLVEGKERETLAGHIGLTAFYLVASARGWTEADRQSELAKR